jgi:hypothetical protein
VTPGVGTLTERADSKRTFHALSNGIWIDILLCPKFANGFGQNRAKTDHLPKPKILSNVCTYKVRADSKRSFDVLSNGIWIDILLCPKFAYGFGQSRAKTDHLPKPKILSNVCTYKVRADSKRSFDVLSNGIWIDILLCPKFAYGFGQSRAKTDHLPKPKILSNVCTYKVRADSKRTFYVLSNDIYINILLLPKLAWGFGQSWSKTRHLPKPKSLSGDRTYKVRADAKRTFYVLSNDIYINILLLPKLAWGFGQSWSKTRHLPKPKILNNVCTLKERADAKRTFYVLSNDIYINILLLPKLAWGFGQSWSKTRHLPKPKILNNVCTLKERADSKRTFDALSNGVYINRL